MSPCSPAYIPLHVHSDYSIQDGLESVEPLVARARQLGLPALALTDWANVCGYIKFYTACRKAGIKPILGADIAVREQEDGSGTPGEHFRLTLLAMNSQGQQNLYDLLSQAWLHSQPGALNPCTCLSDLQRYAQGLILLNGFRGDLARLAHGHHTAALSRRLAFYLQYYADRFCLELTRTGREGEAEFEQLALELCMHHGICPVASNDTVFLYGPDAVGEDGFSDYDIHDVRVSISRGVPRQDPQIAREYSPQQYLRSAQEMADIFADLPEALHNSRAIAERCNVELKLDVPCLPHYETGELTAADYLNQTARAGLAQRLSFLFPDSTERAHRQAAYAARLEEELEVINNMDFSGYFLIVMEFIRWSKDHGVPVGPGRGSGGGSLVAYALGITDFDPIRFDLLFERFLNKERISMPDFDVDFCQRRREMTLDHVRERYGEDAVAQIATFGTLAPKAAVRAAGRAMSLPYGLVDSIASKIPSKPPGLTFADIFTADESHSVAPDFVKLYLRARSDDDKNDEQAKIVDLINTARRIEGVIWSIGKHAAGVVISPTRTAEFTPLMVDKDGNTITQFDKKDVEHAGLVKFDFLGLTTLTIIADALQMINQRIAKENLARSPDAPARSAVDLASIPYTDPRSFEVLQSGDTTAVFQLESQGMRNLILQMQPDRFDDLIALVALYRPGPMKSGMVQHYVDRKQGREAVHYPQPDFEDMDLKPILDPTYGVIVYQEQVMQIAQVLAGYSLGGADILRRAMGKKIASEMAAQRGVFEAGALRLGKDPQIAMRIFDQIETFAEYGFNKSHSAAYALIAWWTLYLKAHYPAEFLAAMMTADRDRAEKLVTYIDNCRRLNIAVMPPDVTVGDYNFSVDEHGAVIFGLGAIKGIGEDLANFISRERASGAYRDFFDFVRRTAPCLNRKSLESLIFSGALDRLGPNRAAMHDSIDTALQYAGQSARNCQEGQLDLLSGIGGTHPSFEQHRYWSNRTLLNCEKKVLGLYLSGHPITEFAAELQYFCHLSIEQALPGTREQPQEVTLCGVVAEHEEKIARHGGKFYVLTIDDGSAQLEFSLFNEQASRFAAILHHHETLRKSQGQEALVAPPALVIIVKGSLFRDEEERRRLRVRELFTLEEKRLENARSITFRLSSGDFERHSQYIRDLMLSNRRIISHPQTEQGLPPATMGCTMQLLINDSLIHLRSSRYRFVPTDAFIDQLREIAGSESVSITY